MQKKKKIELDWRKLDFFQLQNSVQTRWVLCRGHLINSNLEKKFSKYRVIYHSQEELSRTQAVQVPFSLAKHDFLTKVLGGIFLSFQRDSKDFLDIDLYFYTIWLEFSRKKSRTDRMHCLCQEPSNLESSKKMDDLKIPKKKKKMEQNGYIQTGRRRMNVLEVWCIRLSAKWTSPKLSDLNQWALI